MIMKKVIFGGFLFVGGTIMSLGSPGLDLRTLLAWFAIIAGIFLGCLGLKEEQ